MDALWCWFKRFSACSSLTVGCVTTWQAGNNGARHTVLLPAGRHLSSCLLGSTGATKHRGNSPGPGAAGRAGWTCTNLPPRSLALFPSLREGGSKGREQAWGALRLRPETPPQKVQNLEEVRTMIGPNLVPKALANVFSILSGVEFCVCPMFVISKCSEFVGNPI